MGGGRQRGVLVRDGEGGEGVGGEGEGEGGGGKTRQNSYRWGRVTWGSQNRCLSNLVKK